jgi:hypothetical protein
VERAQAEEVMTTTQRVDKRGPLSTEILERAWMRLRRLIPGLPPAVMLPMDAAGRRRQWGHFAPSTWQVRGPKHAHEVAINPMLFSAPDALLATLIHEAAHALLYATAPSGCPVGGVSADGYYHRREFRDACRTLGLDCRYLNGRYGWTLTYWPDTGVPARYARVLALLARLPLGGGRGVPRRVQGRSTPASGQARLQCACEPTRAIYVAKAQAGRGGIVCTFCQSEFRAPAPAALV